MKKRRLENIKIESIGYGGVGIWILDNGKKVLVKGGLPGSVVNGRVLKRKKDYVEVQITEVVSVDQRYMDAPPICPHYLFPYQQASQMPIHKQGCGGCKRQALSYDKQLALKHAIVKDSLGRVIDFEKYPLPHVLGSPLQFQYRNKIEFSCGTYRAWVDQEKTSFDEFVTMWFHQQGYFMQVVDVDQCFLVTPQMHAVYQTIKRDLISSWLPVYRVKQHTGFLRHLVIRQWFHTGQLIVQFSVAGDRLRDHPVDEQIWLELLEQRTNDTMLHQQVTTCIVIDNNGLADIVHHHDLSPQIVWWPWYIFEELHIEEHIVRFQISPFSFFQTNTLGAEVLFQKALDMVGPVWWTILDLYCGSGTIGICFLKAGRGENLVGIEIVPEAVQDASKNALINGIWENTHFFSWKVEKVIVQEKKVVSLLDELSLIIIDPPRQWLHKDVIPFLKELRRTHACKLLYISCNPITFARDAQLLQASGDRQLSALQPVDMFPQTYHIELIGLFS